MWQEDDNSLSKEFKFENFKQALDFVNRVGDIAETMNHHPDVELGWGRVRLTLTTHDAGKVTELDRELANAVDKL